MSTREQLQARLAELARKPPPQITHMGACCYRMAPLAERIDHICSHCGNRTLYVRTAKQGAVPPQPAPRGGLVTRARAFFHNFSLFSVKNEVPAHGLAYCRTLAGTVAKVRLELDESEFCATCSPQVATPQLILVVHAPGAEPRRTRGISSDDLLLLRAFLDGDEIWTGNRRREFPVRDQLPRIAELLGLVQPPKAKT